MNYFFPITKGFKSRDNNNSLLTVEPIPFQKTKQRLIFTLNGNQIEIEFGVAGSYRYKSTSPLSFSSQLSCSFEGTNDTDFLIQIYEIIQRMFFFLCHRRSILFNSIKVKCIDYNDKYTYKRIANELQYYRNAFAHGDIDKELKGDFISDTIILEWLIYCIVLKTAEYTHDEIFNIVNIIFVGRFEDRETESE